jgi:hypothetical protein
MTARTGRFRTTTAGLTSERLHRPALLYARIVAASADRLIAALLEKAP